MRARNTYFRAIIELSLSRKKELCDQAKSGTSQDAQGAFSIVDRHKGLEWAKVQARLEAAPVKLWSLQEMEASGGEPDVVAFDKKTGEFSFYDYHKSHGPQKPLL
jgi:hypothetical protein